jgi:hypothetical protein
MQNDPAYQDRAAWGFESPGESRWPAAATIAAAIVLQFLLPKKLVIGPGWLIPVLEGALLVPLVIGNPSRLTPESRDLRGLALSLVAVVSLANITSLGLLVHRLLHGGKAGGRELIYSAIAIWVTNVLVFGLWYWELDRGGPLARTHPDHRQPDFLFPQMTSPAAAPPRWAPAFVDYLYVSFTNATAFSPTDTMPLTSLAKVLMGVQSLASLTTIGIVAARAVNILS